MLHLFTVAATRRSFYRVDAATFLDKNLMCISREVLYSSKRRLNALYHRNYIMKSPPGDASFPSLGTIQDSEMSNYTS